MQWQLIEVRFPPLAPGTYLEWASWWHRLDLELAETAASSDPVASEDVVVIDHSSLWDEFLSLVGKEASHSMRARSQTIAPALRAPRSKAADAVREGWARLEWLRSVRAGESNSLVDRPMMSLTRRILEPLEEAAGGRLASAF